MNRFRYTPIRPLRDVPVMASTFIRPRPRIEITSPSLTSWDAPLAGCQFTCNSPAFIALTNLVRDTLKPELATASKRKEATVVRTSLIFSSFGAISDSSIASQIRKP